MNIGKRIKELRDGEGLSQAKLAKKIGVSAGNVGEWELERTKPGAEALISLSRYFGVTADWILTGETSTLKLEQKAGGSTFSQEEIDLIAKYRQLSERQKGKIEGHIDEMLGGTKNSNQTETLSSLTSGEEAAARDVG